MAIGSLFDRVATSVGQSVLHSDGFRKDFNLDQSIEQAFIRVDPSELLSVQAEARRLDTHQGNRTLSFDPADLTQVNPTEHQDFGLSVYRVGARLKLGDAGDLGGLGDPVRPRPQRRRGVRRGRAGPSPYERAERRHAATKSRRWPRPGVRSASCARAEAWPRSGATTATSSTSTPFRVSVTFEEETTQDVAYAFVDLRRPLGRTLDLELRLGFDSVDQSELARSTPTPGAGLLWHPSPSFLARVAAGRVLKRPIVVNQTIAPAELAGFDVVLDDRDATISDQVGLAAEYRPFPSLRLGTEIEKRWLSHQETPRAPRRSPTTRRSSTGWATPTGSRSHASP